MNRLLATLEKVARKVSLAVADAPPIERPGSGPLGGRETIDSVI
jgi:hypothetical protein